jgi:hypothetical protein
MLYTTFMSFIRLFDFTIFLNIFSTPWYADMTSE